MFHFSRDRCRSAHHRGNKDHMAYTTEHADLLLARVPFPVLPRVRVRVAVLRVIAVVRPARRADPHGARGARTRGGGQQGSERPGESAAAGYYRRVLRAS